MKTYVGLAFGALTLGTACGDSGARDDDGSGSTNPTAVTVTAASTGPLPTTGSASERGALPHSAQAGARWAYWITSARSWTRLLPTPTTLKSGLT